MTGTSPFAKQLSKRIRHAAGVKDVMIIGERGTGKRFLARQIHDARPRRGTFVLLDGNSVGLSEIEAVLFERNRNLVRTMTGHEAAKLSRNGTLCIANIDALGAHEQDLVASFLQKNRKDLAGLHVVLTTLDTGRISFDVASFEKIEAPALRHRPEDIPDLVADILCSLGKESLRVSDGVLRVLEKGSWPGNIRELAGVVGKGALVSKNDVLDLPEEYLSERQHLQNAIEHINSLIPFSLDRTLWLIEKLLIERLLAITKNNQSRAAGSIGLSEANFRYRLKKFGIKSVREIR